MSVTNLRGVKTQEAVATPHTTNPSISLRLRSRSNVNPEVNTNNLNLLGLPAEILKHIFDYLPRSDKESLACTNSFMNRSLFNLSFNNVKPFTSFEDLYKFVKACKQIKLIDISHFPSLDRKALKKLAIAAPHAQFNIDYKLFYYNSKTFPADFSNTLTALGTRVNEVNINRGSGPFLGEYISQILTLSPQCKLNLNYDLVCHENTGPEVLKHADAFNSVVLSVRINETYAEALERINTYTDKLSGKIHFIAPSFDFFPTPEDALEFFKKNSIHFTGVQLTLSDEDEKNTQLSAILATMQHVKSLSIVCPREVSLDVSSLDLLSFVDLIDLELEGTSNLPPKKVLERCTRISLTHCHLKEDFNPLDYPNLLSLVFHSDNKTVQHFPQKIQRINVSTGGQQYSLNLLGYNSLMHVNVKGNNLEHVFIYNSPALREVSVHSGRNDFMMRMDSCPVLTGVLANVVNNIKITHSASVRIEEWTTID